VHGEQPALSRHPPGHPALNAAERGRKTGTVTIKTVYAATSLSAEQSTPADPARLIRSHRNTGALHHARDVTFAQDAPQLPTGTAPRATATRRNLSIAALRPAGNSSTAAGLRRNTRGASRPLTLPGPT
jgi:hypothetical protein